MAEREYGKAVMERHLRNADDIVSKPRLANGFIERREVSLH